MTPPEHLHDPATGQHLTFLQTRRVTGGRLLQLEVRLEPGGRVPRHVHVRQDERVSVVEGSITVRVGRLHRTLHAGESADVPRRSVHVVRNDGERDARFVLEVRPARRMQGAMRALFAASGTWSALRSLPRSLVDRKAIDVEPGPSRSNRLHGEES